MPEKIEIPPMPEPVIPPESGMPEPWQAPQYREEPKTVARWRLLRDQLTAAVGSLRSVLAGLNLCSHETKVARDCPRCLAAEAALKLPVPYEGVLAQAIITAALAGDAKALATAVEQWQDWHSAPAGARRKKP